MSCYFSIITPTYNRARLLKEAAESVLSQTFSDFEFIIVDDASTDDTETLVSSFKDPRIKYIRNTENLERGASRNKGILTATGKYICFLDSDDYFSADHLSTFHQWIEKETRVPALLYSNSSNITDEGYTEKRNAPEPEGNLFDYILIHTFNPSRTCIHRYILKEFVFDETISGLEDLDLWLRIATKYPVINIPVYTSFYRVHKESYTSGDSFRYVKELKNFKIIFSKPELKDRLSSTARNRLLSMCHFHLAQMEAENKQWLTMYIHILKSYFLCRQGYNNKTNKIIAVLFLYHIPVVGTLIKFINRFLKKESND